MISCITPYGKDGLLLQCFQSLCTLAACVCFSQQVAVETMGVTLSHFLLLMSLFEVVRFQFYNVTWCYLLRR